MKQIEIVNLMTIRIRYIVIQKIFSYQTLSAIH